MVDETMFEEAVSAVRNGENNRARGLLTRLIKTDPKNVDCWIWMSAVVETPKERIYCLQEALKVDPSNPVAQRGLIMVGMLPPNEKFESVGPIQRNWQSSLQADLDKKEPVDWRRIATLGLAGLLVVILIILGVIRGRNVLPAVGRLIPANTLRPSSTFLPTNTPSIRTPSPTISGPVPLWMLLKSTYTPTPLYVATAHARTEAFQTAMFRFSARNYTDAIPLFQQALTIEQQSPDIQYLIGECYRLLGNNSEALKQYDLAIKTDSNFAPLYLGRAIVSLQLDPKADIRPDLLAAITRDANLGEAFFQLAALDLQEGQYQAVLEDTAQAARSRPDSPWVFLYQAQAYLGLNQAEDALHSAQKAIQLDITILISYRILGQAFQANDDLPSSIPPLKTYLVYQSDDPTAWIMLGKAYYAQKDLNNAEAAYSKAIDLADSSFDAYLGRGVIYLEQDKNEQAVNDLYKAYQMDSKSFSACLDLGRALTQNGSFTEAAFQFKQAEKLAASDADMAAVYYWRATNLDASGQPLLAVADWRKLLALPASAVPEEWAVTAQKRISDANTATRTLTPSASSTPTRTATRTSTPTATPTR